MTIVSVVRDLTPHRMNSDTSSPTAVTRFPETSPEDSSVKMPAPDTPSKSDSEEISAQTPLADILPTMASENTTLQATPPNIGSEEAPSASSSAVNPHPQVHFKSDEGRLVLLLPSNPENSRSPIPWSELWLQLKQRLNGGDRFWRPHTVVHLAAGDRLLDGRQLQAIAEAARRIPVVAQAGLHQPTPNGGCGRNGWLLGRSKFCR